MVKRTTPYRCSTNIYAGSMHLFRNFWEKQGKNIFFPLILSFGYLYLCMCFIHWSSDVYEWGWFYAGKNLQLSISWRLELMIYHLMRHIRCLYEPPLGPSYWSDLILTFGIKYTVLGFNNYLFLCFIPYSGLRSWVFTHPVGHLNRNRGLQFLCIKIAPILINDNDTWHFANGTFIAPLWLCYIIVESFL